MMQTVNPVSRLRRFRHITLALGGLALIGAVTWVVYPVRIMQIQRPPRHGESVMSNRRVHPEHWQIMLAPVVITPVPVQVSIPMKLVSIVHRGSMSSAMLSVDNGALTTVSVGSDILGWKVLNIGVRNVELEKDGSKRVVELGNE
jgi:hypothetical protein